MASVEFKSGCSSYSNIETTQIYTNLDHREMIRVID